MTSVQQDLTELDKWRLCAIAGLFYNHETSRFRHRGLDTLSQSFGISRRRVQQVFNEFLEQFHQETPEDIELKPKKRGRKEGALKLTDQVEQDIKEIVRNRRGEITYRQLTEKMYQKGHEMCCKTIYNYCRIMGVMTSRSYVKPLLREYDKMCRMRFVLNHSDNVHSCYHRTT